MAGNDAFYPGVQVVERPFQPGRTTSQDVATYAAFVGAVAQGPTSPTFVGSWSEFLSVYGTTITDLHAAVSDFFNNGGTAAYIQRVPGAGAAKGDVDIYANDAPEDPGNPGQVLPGTPPLFTFEALNPGSWANRLYVVIYTRDLANKRFDVVLYNVPNGVTFDSSKRNSSYQLEQWADLSLDPADARYMYDVINAPSASGSTYVRVYGQSYDPNTPSVKPYPDTAGANQLLGGTDGSYLAPSFDNDTAYQAAISALAEIPGPFVINMPNVVDPDIIRFAATFAANRGDCCVIADTPQGLTTAEVVSYVETDLSLNSLGGSVPSYVSVYWPWVYLPAVGSGSSSKTVLRSPGGAVLGSWMASDRTFGVWKAPAGHTQTIVGATALERKLTDSDLTTLNSKHINAIRSIPGVGIAVMGARTTKLSGLDMYINVRRSMIYLSQTLRRATEYAAFRTNDSRLWTDITSVCTAILTRFWQSGGLKGATASEAFFVRCNATNNPPSSVDAGIVNIEVGVAFTTPAEFIIITIGQFDGGSTVSSTL